MLKFFTIKNTGIFEVNEKENTNSRSIGDISQIGLYHWEIRDLGSNFSNEIRFAKLLASIATAIPVFFHFQSTDFKASNISTFFNIWFTNIPSTAKIKTIKIHGQI